MGGRRIVQQIRSGGKCLGVIGLGNIGSHLVAHLARLPGIGRVRLIDFDRYEAKNYRGQEILMQEVGNWKAEVQARRLGRINPAIQVEAVCQRVENVPLGLLRGDLILAGVDSRIARWWINQMAWRLGVPWLDAAVDGGGLLVRINAYLPGQCAPCLECGWDDADYRALEQSYPCLSDGAGPAPTNAPSCVGAVAASLMAVECFKLLTGDMATLVHGRQVLIDLRHHTHYVTRFERNPQCRFDHTTWDIEPLERPPSRLTVAQAIQTAAGQKGDCQGWELRVEGKPFAYRQYCANCHRTWSDHIYLAQRIPGARRQCPACGKPMDVRGSDMSEVVALPNLSRAQRRRSLSSLGLRPGDVFSVHGPAGQRHFELGGCLAKDSMQLARRPNNGRGALAGADLGVPRMTQGAVK